MFFYIPTISKNKGYENLAASIGSTNETFNQSYSNDFDSSEAPTFLGYFKLLVPPAVRRPFILLIKHGDQWVTQLCSIRSPDSFCISFCIQKVSGDLHYLLAKRLVNSFWLSSLMNVNFVSPEVFSFNLHLLKVLKLHLYRTKTQWVITKKVLNSKI